MRIITCIAAAVALGLAAPANAEDSAKDLLAEIDAGNKDAPGVFIAGIGNGISWTNSAMKATGRAPLYCPPPDRGFNGEDYIQMLRDFVRGKSIEADLPTGMALLLALQDRFPCAK